MDSDMVLGSIQQLGKVQTGTLSVTRIPDEVEKRLRDLEKRVKNLEACITGEGDNAA